MAVESGIPVFDNGVWVGATDFSEFDVAVGRPAGITIIPPSTGAPTGEQIADDPDEGRYFSATPTEFEGLAYILDAFAGLDPAPGDSIELLARCWVPGELGNRRIWGPAFELAGTDHLDIDYAGGGIYLRAVDPDDYESTAIRVDAGNASAVLSSDLQEAEQQNAWFWQRFRAQHEASGAGTADWKIKTWYGALADEPAGWDGEANAAAIIPGLGNNAIGWAVTALVRQDEQRIAFLSFTTDSDPDSNPPPGPDDVLVSGDIVPPDVTVTELQATWIAAETTPFEVAE